MNEGSSEGILQGRQLIEGSGMKGLVRDSTGKATH